MTEDKIKPIPKYIENKIRILDKKIHDPSSIRRFYSYLTKYDGELCQVFVAVRNRYKKWYIKQVAVHTIHSDTCLVKDFNYFYIAGHVVSWYEEGLSKYRKSWEYEGWTEASSKYFQPYSICVNKKYALKFPQYKYSAVDKYRDSDIINYLRLYEVYPQMEYLTKLGLDNIVTSKQILKLVSKDKSFRKWIVKNREQLMYGNNYISSIIKAFKTNQPLDYIQKYEEIKKEIIHNHNDIKTTFKNDLDTFIKYLIKHNIDIITYLDYMISCNYLKLDMTVPKNRYPKDFIRWHDIRADEYNTARAIADKKAKEELYNKFSVVSDKYHLLENKGNDFVVVIAKTPYDLVKEGRSLHHCVGSMNYDQKFIREESLIFFIRNIDDTKTPFVTLEYSIEKKKILQCYADHNSKPSNEVMDYLNKKWLPYTKRQLKKIA